MRVPFVRAVGVVVGEDPPEARELCSQLAVTLTLTRPSNNSSSSCMAPPWCPAVILFLTLWLPMAIRFLLGAAGVDVPVAFEGAASIIATLNFVLSPLMNFLMNGAVRRSIIATLRCRKLPVRDHASKSKGHGAPPGKGVSPAIGDSTEVATAAAEDLSEPSTHQSSTHQSS